jgi:hypothetical protein
VKPKIIKRYGRWVVKEVRQYMVFGQPYYWVLQRKAQYWCQYMNAQIRMRFYD